MDGYEQANNAQATVDAAEQVITAADVGAEQSDCAQLDPMIDQLEASTGSRPQQVVGGRRLLLRGEPRGAG